MPEEVAPRGVLGLVVRGHRRCSSVPSRAETARPHARDAGPAVDGISRCECRASSALAPRAAARPARSRFCMRNACRAGEPGARHARGSVASSRRHAGQCVASACRAERALDCRVLAALGVVACSVGDEPARLHTTIQPPAAVGRRHASSRGSRSCPRTPARAATRTATPDPRERTLTEFHTQKVLHHGTQKGWCYRCHTKDDIDQLHLRRRHARSASTRRTSSAARATATSCATGRRASTASRRATGSASARAARARRATIPHDPHFPLMTPEHAPARPRTVPPSRRRTEESRWTKDTDERRDAARALEKLVETRLDERGTRRTFLKIAGAAAAAAGRGLRQRRADERGVLPAALQEAHATRTRSASSRASRRRRSRGRASRTHIERPAADRRRRVRVRAEPLGVQRQPPLRRGVRAREQPARRSRDSVHPRARDGGAARIDFEDATPLRATTKVPAKEQVLPAGAVPPVRQPAVRARRARSGARGRSPTASSSSTTTGASAAASASSRARTSRGASTAPRRASRPSASTRTRATSRTGRATRASSRSARSACTARATGGCRRASRRARPARASSATCNDPNSEIRKIIETKRVFVLKEELATLPRFYYFFA